MLEHAKKQGRKFLNPIETQMGGLRIMLKLLPMYLSNREETEPKEPLGPFLTDPRAYRVPSANGLRVTWFGHSSSLLEIDGMRVLIDPVWDKRSAPLTWFGPKRFFAPTIALENLPPADVVLISHDHYDHLGGWTIRRLAELWTEVRWVCPLGVATELRKFGVRAEQVTELDWTDVTVVAGMGGTELRFTAVPTRHFSGRSLTNRFETLWAAYVITGSRHRVFFGADSGVWDGFEEIGSTYGPFDLTMLEIGAFHEMWKEIHMGPDGAAEAFAQLGGGLLMPIHWGLFNLALHAWRQPIERMTEIAEELGLRLFSPTPGVPSEVGEVRSGWWRKG